VAPASKELAPHVTKAAVLFNPETTALSAAYMGSIDEAALALKVETSPAHAKSLPEIEAVLVETGRSGSGLIVVSDAFMRLNRIPLISAAARHKVPSVYPATYFVRDGGLASYGIDIDDLYPRTAVVADRILRGDRPGDIPVEYPTKYELALNLNTAKALGLMIPPTLLARADEVIE